MTEVEIEEPIMLPYGCEVRQEAFDIFCEIAQRIHAEAVFAVDWFIAEVCKTLDITHANGCYQRTIRTPDWGEVVVPYDYRTKAVWTG